MRWLIAFSALIAWVATPAEIAITTWNLQWFPSGTSLRAQEDKEMDRIHQAALVLKSIDADIILLQEIRDFATCYRLAKELVGYKVAICSQFTEFGGIIGWQQVAILSKQEAISAWSENWKAFGTVDPPRGFAFAHFRFGTNDVAVYSLHLKSNLVRGSDEREIQLNIFKREVAAEQVVYHLKETEKAVANQFEAVVVAGDFNTEKEQFPSEATLQVLGAAGFTSGFEGLPIKDRITHPAAGKYPNATFDYIFVRPAAMANAPAITATNLSDHYPVVRTIRLP